jgi:hypothetical protein
MNAQLPLAEPILALEPPAEIQDPRPFNWASDNDAVVVPPQGAIAIFENGNDSITIMQESPNGVDPDVVITVQPKNVRVIVEALLRVLTDLERD